MINVLSPCTGNSARPIIAAAILRGAGMAPVVIEYLKPGWTEPQLLGLLAAAGLRPRTALRTFRSPPEAMGLIDPAVSEPQILAAMVSRKILVNRPIVCTAKGVRLCRPSETVLELLDHLPPLPLTKEDRTVILDADGRPPR